MTGPGLIEDYALLSDLRTAALIGKDGSLDWLCLPRFDAPACFARLLGGEGRWSIAPTEPVREVRRRYRDNSLVLETEFRTDSGVLRLIDFMPPHEVNQHDEPCVVRIVEGVSGEVGFQLDWVLRFDYGDSVPWVRRVSETEPVLDEYVLGIAGPNTVVLRGEELPTRVDGERAHRHTGTISAGQRMSWVLQWASDPDELPAPMDPEQELLECEGFWRDWSAKIVYDGPYPKAVRRSLATLKALIYAPTGGIVAAPTTSLPEAVPGKRNWDYRYCWLRDATLVLLALDDLGCTSEAEAWRRWLVRSVAGDPADLQIMYGVGGERHLIEWEADWLRGYRDTSPVRVGNAAYRQRQLDVYGEVMDALHLARERGLVESEDSWALQRGMLAHLERIWREPDRGLWEVRGPDRHFTHSQVMVWVAFDRAVRGAEEDGLPGPVEHWRELRDEVREEVLRRAWNPEIRALPSSTAEPRWTPRCCCCPRSVSSPATTSGCAAPSRPSSASSSTVCWSTATRPPTRRTRSTAWPGGRVRSWPARSGWSTRWSTAVGARRRSGCSPNSSRWPTTSVSTPRSSTPRAAASPATSRRRSATSRWSTRRRSSTADARGSRSPAATGTAPDASAAQSRWEEM